MSIEERIRNFKIDQERFIASMDAKIKSHRESEVQEVQPKEITVVTVVKVTTVRF